VLFEFGDDSGQQVDRVGVAQLVDGRAA